MIKEVFSVRNSKDKLHKIVTIFGLKIKFKYYKAYLLLNKKYQKKVKQLVEKTGTSKIRVAFYVNDPKWKSQGIFNEMQKSNLYEPFVIVSKTTFPKGHFEETSDEELLSIYDSFKEKEMPVYLAYDIEKGKAISLKEFVPDIIFYSRPFEIIGMHRPENVADFALTCYIPYFISNSPAWLEANRIFHNNIWKYYVLNNDLKTEYSRIMHNKGKNLAVCGYPFLDAYNDTSTKQKHYIIYAPHWSVGRDSDLKYATFEWNGIYMLEFAKKHPEIEWVFKPHPTLRHKLVHSKIMTEEEVDNYYNEWDKIGIKYEGSDYLDLFKESKALITDCGSFLAEYMPTENPVILLRSEYATPYNFLAKKVTKYYYKAHNLNELEGLLDEVVINGIDNNKEKRLKMLKSLNLVTNAAQNIIEDLNKEFNIK